LAANSCRKRPRKGDTKVCVTETATRGRLYSTILPSRQSLFRTPDCKASWPFSK
jgi:hypothetical protein